MPGRVFASPVDFSDWLTLANARVVRTIETHPVDWFEVDWVAMLPLPPVATAVGCVNRVGTRLLPPPRLIGLLRRPAVTGRFVDVTADLSRVEVRHEGRLVAAHDRVWAGGMTMTDPAHVATANVLRAQFQRLGSPLAWKRD